MKIDRLLKIITLLLQQSKVTIPQLAERFEVSRRTISRDVETIQMAGIPIETIQGYQGGIRISPGYRMNHSVLTQEELESLLAVLQGVHSISSQATSSQLREKLTNSGSSISPCEDYIFIDLASTYQSSLIPKMECLKKAIRNHLEVELIYHSPQQKTTRMVQPVALFFHWSSWYLYAFCLEKNDFRLFKINRIESITSTSIPFQPRVIDYEQLNLNSYFDQVKFSLVALFDPAVHYRLIDEYGLDCTTLQQDGRLKFERDFTNEQVLLTWLLGFGSQVEVLQPLEIRTKLIDQAKKTIQLYQLT